MRLRTSQTHGESPTPSVTFTGGRKFAISTHNCSKQNDTRKSPMARPNSLEEAVCKREGQMGDEKLKLRQLASYGLFHLLDSQANCLQSLFRKKAAPTKVATILGQLFRAYDLQEQVDVHVRRAAVLRAIPAYLNEDDSGFLKLCDKSQSDEPNIDDLPVGLLLISANSTNATFVCPDRTAVVLESIKVINFPTLADGFVMLFALIYGLPLSYPKDLANTFDFIQKVLMCLDDRKLRPRVNISLQPDDSSSPPTPPVTSVCFTADKVRRQLSGRHSNKAKGPDGVGPGVL
ncbi:hypothetical protein FQN60_005414 [Etheostoma spectabile]|uniref:Uncharacterized protein n=1 Tax=Etheostoma spectabile TaxID=54343 RepID=A0A5J5CEZ1_9PERO|nr:hypothetical protein FQN60_005414 [Etheostoma spectabile]